MPENVRKPTCPETGFAAVPPPGPLRLVGKALAYNAWSRETPARYANRFRAFRHLAMPGCYDAVFAAVATGEQDVKLLVNHGGPELASTRDGSLRLFDFTGGLMFGVYGGSEMDAVAALAEQYPCASIDSAAYEQDLRPWDHDPQVGLTTAIKEHLFEISMVEVGAHVDTWVRRV